MSYIIGIIGYYDFVETYDINPEKMENHDAAVALLKDGKIISAIENERIDRIKHSNKLPYDGVRYCLESEGLNINDISKFSWGRGNEWLLNQDLAFYYLEHNEITTPLIDARTLLANRLSERLDGQITSDKIDFVNHDRAHALSSYAISGFNESLVITIDARGDENICTTISMAKDTLLKNIATYRGLYTSSIGAFYISVCRMLGYDVFDEYKVMGLAPYGDPKKFRQFMETTYSLKEDGLVEFHLHKFTEAVFIKPIRRKNQPFTQEHKDFAAAAQEALENQIFHIAKYFQKKTGLRNLCLAGGVAQNCTVNGKLLLSGLFDNIFVPPAAHDAGLAIGAAIDSYWQESNKPKLFPIQHAYLGAQIKTNKDIETELELWCDWCAWQRLNNTEEQVAELLANGNVIGWMQGRSEFGPRALGNRSILADPRPEENKSRINAMIKKREGYRPFAPSVLEEAANDYFDIPKASADLSYMNFILSVKEKWHSILRAITHVDGTARIQTVSKKTNPRYWKLIKSFGDITGIPILLNTSFNNNVEPIIDSLRDGIVCFLTTELDYLIVGDVLVERKENDIKKNLGKMKIDIPRYVRFEKTYKWLNGEKKQQCEYKLATSARWHDIDITRKISKKTFELLEMNHKTNDPIDTLINDIGVNDIQEREKVLLEIFSLWEERLINIQP
jgi:carbamoyltransferase